MKIFDPTVLNDLAPFFDVQELHDYIWLADPCIREKLDVLNEQLIKQDYEKMRETAHALSGACNCYGLKAMADLAKQIEYQVAGPEEINEMIGKIHILVTESLTAVNNWKKERI